MIIPKVFPPTEVGRYHDLDIVQVAVLWCEENNAISFQWGIVHYMEVGHPMTSTQIIKEATEKMPQTVADFIALYNNPATQEEAKVLFALGFVQNMNRGDICNNG